MKKKFFLLTATICMYCTGYAQVIISDIKGGTVPETQAELKVISEHTGVLLPRLSKIRINEKENNHTGELFFSKEHNCLMLNTAPVGATRPEWKCIANEPEAIPKSE